MSVPGRRRPARQRGRAGQLRGRRRECDLLDQHLASVHAGESRVLVVRGEPGVGKTALLDYLVEQASGCRVAQAAGVESEMELVYAGLHQLLTPMLDRLERLPAPQANALRTAFGLSSGSAPDRFLVGLAALSLLLVTVWLRSVGRNPAYAGIPMVFMYVTTMAATVVTAYNLFATIATRSGMATISVLGAWAMIAVAVLLLAAAALIAYDAWQAWNRYRAAPEPEPAAAATG